LTTEQPVIPTSSGRSGGRHRLHFVSATVQVGVSLDTARKTSRDEVTKHLTRQHRSMQCSDSVDEPDAIRRGSTLASNEWLTWLIAKPMLMTWSSVDLNPAADALAVKAG